MRRHRPIRIAIAATIVGGALSMFFAHHTTTTPPPPTVQLAAVELGLPIVHAPADALMHPVKAAKAAILVLATYTVKVGDNLFAIAKHFLIHGGWPTLYKWNHAVVGSNPNLIFPGQKLTVNFYATT